MAPKDDVDLSPIMALSGLQIDKKRHPFDFILPSHLAKWPTAESQNVTLQTPLLSHPKYSTDSCVLHKRPVSSLYGSAPRFRKSVDRSDIPLVLDHKLTLDPSSLPSPPPPRPDGPLTFMSLPRELRDQIYDLTIDQEDTTRTAKLRSVFRRKQNGGTQKVTCRFPVEPPLASVSRQLRHEVLTMHYGGFALRIDKNVQQMIKEFYPRLFTPPGHGQPDPLPSAHMYIKHLKLFMEGEPVPVELELKVLACGNVQLRLGALAHCTCLDRLALDLFLNRQIECGVLERSVDPGGILHLKLRRARDLITLASSILLKRQSIGNYTNYCGPNMMGHSNPVRDCGRCGRPRLRSTQA